jgi:hypothetical protein
MNEKKELIFVFGVSGSGKTFYCLEQSTQNNGFHVHIDCLGNKAFQKIDDSLEQNKQINKFYIDGLNPILFKEATKKYKQHNITCKVMILPLYFLKHTQTIRERKVQSTEQILDFYVGLHDFINFYKKIWIIDSVNETETISKENFAITILRKSITNKEALKKKILEKIIETYGSLELNYHTIFLGEEMIKGCTPAEQTWNIIKEHCDFKDKSIIDIGPCTGYFLHKTHLEKAETMIGYEIDEQRRNLAKMIIKYNELPIWIINKDVCEEKIFYEKDKEYLIWFYRDYTLVLNLYHWFKNKQNALKHIFSDTQTIIFEVNNEHINEILEYAKQKDFGLKHKEQSRINRHILILEKGLTT